MVVVVVVVWVARPSWPKLRLGHLPTAGEGCMTCISHLVAASDARTASILSGKRFNNNPEDDALGDDAAGVV